MPGIFNPSNISNISNISSIYDMSETSEVSNAYVAHLGVYIYIYIYTYIYIYIYIYSTGVAYGVLSIPRLAVYVCIYARAGVWTCSYLHTVRVL
jgi:hypothetical protein